jgi:hypothetical protein
LSPVFIWATSAGLFAEKEHRCEQVVGQRTGDDRDDSAEEARVGVASLVFRIDVFERVHPGDLHVGEKGDDGDLVDRGAPFRLVANERGAEPDRKAGDAHLEGAGREVMAAFVDHHEESEPEDSENPEENGHSTHYVGDSNRASSTAPRPHRPGGPRRRGPKAAPSALQRPHSRDL